MTTNEETIRAMHAAPRLLVAGIWYVLYEGVLLATPSDSGNFYAEDLREVDMSVADKRTRELREAIRAALNLMDAHFALWRYSDLLEREAIERAPNVTRLHDAALAAAKAFGNGLEV